MTTLYYPQPSLQKFPLISTQFFWLFYFSYIKLCIVIISGGLIRQCVADSFDFGHSVIILSFVPFFVVVLSLIDAH